MRGRLKRADKRKTVERKWWRDRVWEECGRSVGCRGRREWNKEHRRSEGEGGINMGCGRSMEEVHLV